MMREILQSGKEVIAEGQVMWCRVSGDGCQKYSGSAVT